MRVARRYLSEKRGHVIEEIRRHHRRRHRRIAHQLAGQHADICAAENAVDVIKVVERRHLLLARVGLAVDQKGLVAVHQVVQRPAPVLRELPQLQIAEVAVRRLPFLIKAFRRLGREQPLDLPALGLGNRLQQLVLLRQVEMHDLQALAAVFLDQRPMRFDVLRLAAVFGDDHRDLGGAPVRIPPAVAIQPALLVDAFEAGPQMRRPVRHRNADQEMMLQFLSGLLDQALLFAKQRLIRRQPCFEVR